MRKQSLTWDGNERSVNPYHSLLLDLDIADNDGADGIPVQYTAISGTIALAFAMGNLTEREQKVLMQRYLMGMTYEESGETFGVTRERIRQMKAKALRKLRGRRNVRELLQKGILTYWNDQINARAAEIAKDVIDGYKFALDKAYEQKIQDKCAELELDPTLIERRKRAEQAAEPIENLDLSVRAYNCLKRGNIDTVGDLTGKTYMDILNLRNMGRKTADEIAWKLREHGLTFAPEGGNEM